MLSNKLTFSLSFIVMLVVGLAFMATSVMASPYLKADYDDTDDTWDVVIDDAVDADNTVSPGPLAVDTPLIEDADLAADTDALNNATLDGSIAVTYIQKDLTTSATTTGNTAWVRYSFTLDPTTDAQDSMLTLDGYHAVTFKGRATGAPAPRNIPRVPLTADDGTSVYTIAVDFDPSEGKFHVVYRGDENTDGILTLEDTGSTSDSDFPDLNYFFQRGGTIKVVGSGVIITEVMWGHDINHPTDTDDPGQPNLDKQWIELFYTGTGTDAVGIVLVFVYDHYDATGGDEVSNLHLGKWSPHGQSGRTWYLNDGSPPVSVISMYRKITLAVDGREYHVNRDGKYDHKDGALPGSWAASAASFNMELAHVGTPGGPHLQPRVGTEGALTTMIMATPLRFSEVRNDKSADDVDWIEIENVSDSPVNLKDWEISVVTGVSRNNLSGKEHRAYGQLLTAERELEIKKDGKVVGPQTGNENDKAIVGNDDFNRDGQNDVTQFPNWNLPAGAFLLIVNQDPADTILASGKDIMVLADAAILDKTTNKGAGFYYFMTDKLNGRLDARKVGDAPGEPLLILRNKLDKNETADNIIDVAGAGYYADESDQYRYNFNTKVWPLRGDPGMTNDRHAGSKFSSGGTWDLTRGDPDQWWKSNNAADDARGLGYDPGVDLRYAPGTPGYANNAVKDKLIDKKGTSDTADDEVLLNGNISISEIMFDASVRAGNERWNLVQWIELYNSSMTEAINLKDWRLEVRNSDDHVDSFVDSGLNFKDAHIHPNQTLLLVSARATNAGISENRVYNLYTNHARELGLSNRRANLLSPAGFNLKLYDKNGDLVDEVGNVAVNGRQRTTADWETMPPPEGPVRYSLVRRYGTREEDGNGPDLPAVGTMEDGWIVADLDGGSPTHYGHGDDIGTPGHRQGGPLPVSLSSFRPVRNEDTGHVVIRWITQSELNNAGFNILRSETKNGEFKVVNIKGIIAGHGTTSEKHVYEWTDTTAKPNVVYYYQIEDVSFDGQRQTLTTRRLRGHVSAGGKLTTTWSSLKQVK